MNGDNPSDDEKLSYGEWLAKTYQNPELNAGWEKLCDEAAKKVLNDLGEALFGDKK